jgi:F-type H+-transporting ATPase subunit gamma
LANLKAIRKRISSVKSTQKITRAQKMVAGARLTRAQHRIQALRPYAVKTAQVLAEVAGGGADEEGAIADGGHPLLARRAEKTILLLVITSDRGLCGAFNTNILRAASKIWHEREAAGQGVKIVTIGRKGRDFFRRRNAPVLEVLSGVWEKLDIEQARSIARKVLTPFVSGEVDSVYVVYNEFKSAMSQRVVSEPLFPLQKQEAAEPRLDAAAAHEAEWASHREYLFEPARDVLLERLVPMYIEVSILRALYESQASELGSRMTAMESATKKAAEMIAKYTLIYNRARQAAITTELMEIISGAEALRE